jgi:DnaJ-class molecular chaperone
MESATSGPGNGEAQEHPERECMACRATGNVISHLGGEVKTVTCPWCGGTGVRGAISDAQAKWKDPEEASEDA